ncbi:hypothetical protein J6590_060650, partial [Homalodisca vitripennis]
MVGSCQKPVTCNGGKPLQAESSRNLRTAQNSGAQKGRKLSEDEILVFYNSFKYSPVAFTLPGDLVTQRSMHCNSIPQSSG